MLMLPEYKSNDGAIVCIRANMVWIVSPGCRALGQCQCWGAAKHMVTWCWRCLQGHRSNAPLAMLLYRSWCWMMSSKSYVATALPVSLQCYMRANNGNSHTDKRISSSTFNLRANLASVHVTLIWLSYLLYWGTVIHYVTNIMLCSATLLLCMRKETSNTTRVDMSP